MYSYKGVNGNEDYNRFDLEIIEMTNYWNNVFFNQQYPPPELLNPNLIKAMIYIESRMGYYESNSYSAYPDIMQVANSANPAIHTLNNDGWMDQNTDRVTREYEWKEGKGKEGEILDYNGEANGNTPKESIKWGIRWLYHKAQGITHQGTRYWRQWNEAVQNYNTEGNIEYEKAVYDAYRRGADKRNKKYPLKLRTIILIISGISLVSVFGLKIYNNQGVVWLSFKEGKEERISYILMANVLNGLRVKKTEISKFYSDGRNPLAITRKSNPHRYPQNLFGDENYEIIVIGEDVADSLIRYILKKTENGLTVVPHKGEYGDKDIRQAFGGDWIDFIDIDGDGIVEVRESHFIPYKNAPDQIWHLWYRYNERRGMYEFFKKEKINYREFDALQFL